MGFLVVSLAENIIQLHRKLLLDCVWLLSWDIKDKNNKNKADKIKKYINKIMFGNSV
jgi:hypothetical protein